jgi:hypothetical protein
MISCSSSISAQQQSTIYNAITTNYQHQRVHCSLLTKRCLSKEDQVFSRLYEQFETRDVDYLHCWVVQLVYRYYFYTLYLDLCHSGNRLEYMPRSTDGTYYRYLYNKLSSWFSDIRVYGMSLFCFAKG